MKIGIQGIAGSYSEMTAQDYITGRIANENNNEVKSDFEIMMYSSFHEATHALLEDDVELIVVPIENSTTGAVAKMMDQIRYNNLISIAEAYQPVSHTLWGVESSRLAQITTVYSHPEALKQCDGFFERNPQIESKAYDDTARAARYIKELNLPNVAAISSSRAGELYGLSSLIEDVQDEKNNMTRFYVLEKKQEKKEYRGNVLSFYVETRHEAGALLKVLQVFDIFSTNMLSLTARPIENRPFTYGFFLEVSVDKMTAPYDVLIQTLENVAEYVQLTGQFDLVKRPSERI